MSGKCYECRHSLGKKEKQEITTECKHTLHYDCAKKRLTKDKKSHCPECKKPNALSEAVNRFEKKISKGIDGDEGECGWICRFCDKNNLAASNFCGHCGKERKSSASAVSGGSTSKASEGSRDSKATDGWECNSCSYENDSSSSACANCKKARDDRCPSEGSIADKSPIIHDLVAKDVLIKDSASSSAKSKTNLSVYITDMPSDIEDDAELEKELRRRLQRALHLEPVDLKCHSSLGTGVIWVANKEEQNILIESGIKLTIGSKGQSKMISFSETFELMSFIVFDIPSKTDSTVPSAKQVSQRWTELYSTDQLTVCEQLNTEFPNIYRIVSTSLPVLVDCVHHPDFKVKGCFAKIYAGADCSFLEDIPPKITEEQLETMIIDSINTSRITPSMIHVQLNKTTHCACVVVMAAARLWSNRSTVVVDGKTLTIKENISFYLLIHPVPQSFNTQKILGHEDFYQKVTVYKHSGDELVLLTADKNLYDDCIRRGAIRIEGKHTLNIERYIPGKKSGDNEIDEETWYNVEMPKMKPDIMQFIDNPKHDIFRYKWNAKIWLEQFDRTEKIKSNDRRCQMQCTQRGDMGNQLRHKLQVTVMLNTLGTIRNNGYYFAGREVKLRLKKTLKTIVYKHDSVLEKGGAQRLSKAPYDKTKIMVVKDDCVVAYKELEKRGKQPVLLNMASATSPGGGYRKGDGAQEENLFRRSDYFRSLDVGLDKFLNEPNERLYCTSNGQEKPIRSDFQMYPMDEFGAIYTSGITFFRHSQDVGYEYMEEPLENVSAIAMAAYRDPKLSGNLLDDKYAIGARKKIENIFSIAYRNGHDSLVLSALGCGAFHNPPHHVAKLFESVIEQYAGFFETIVFAIIDDHNAGHKLNPEGNFSPFEEIFHGKIFYPVNAFNKPNTMVGPFEILSNGKEYKDVSIFDAIPCRFGAKCRDLADEKHGHDFSHPPICMQIAMNGKCESIKDPVHIVSYIHRKQCPYGGECRLIDDDKHNRDLEHPSYCSAGGRCQDMQKNHLQQFRHLPLCKEGHGCLRYKKHVAEHCQSFRHCKPRCSYGFHCANIHNKTHMNDEEHPFQTPCPWTPYRCPDYITFSEATSKKALSEEVQIHCLSYAHVCRYGRDCRDTSELHWEMSIHIARSLCRDGDRCTQLGQEDHLNSYTHPNIHDIRRLCSHGEKCHDRYKVEHITKFRHPIIFEDSGIVRYDDLNKGINFVENQSESITRVLNYIQAEGWKTLPSNQIPNDILRWIRRVQPVHRCNQLIFESILLHGHVMSRDHMENLKKPKFVAHSVMQHSRVRRIANLRVPAVVKHAQIYVRALVSSEFEKHGMLSSGSLAGIMDAADSDAVTLADIIKGKEKVLADLIDNGVAVLKAKAIEIAQASIKLHANPAGIGHTPDKALGTDKHVFSILGPHLGHYYGDIILIFKRDILHHPDADFSIQAATSFASGRCYKWRPWLGSQPGDPNENVKLYHRSKLHASIPGYDYATALELMAIVSHDLKLKSMDFDLQTVFKRWLANDSHSNIEAHLPPLIPLDYIDHIYIPKNLYAGLSADARKSVDAVFKHCMTITPHDGLAAQPMGPSGPKPDGDERVKHQNFVVNDLLKKYADDAKYNLTRVLHGAVITLPAAEFAETFAVPLTFSQAYQQYMNERKKAPADDIVYVYWSAMHGDMMLVLSNERIDQEPQPQCLMCYIAPKNTAKDTDYHEQATYLNVGKPNQHHICTTSGKYLAKSNTFHIGCNLDDFVTYCLEIHSSTGDVTLRHAGPNGIYNHEIISCNVSKSRLDLKKLEFIQLTAGTRIVPVRNLMVFYEKPTHLHPTSDKNFKATARAAKDSKDDDKKDSKASDHDGSKKKDGASSSLTPCQDSINCLLQYSPDSAKHNSKYSHPCRFSELCREKEPHLTHHPHTARLCRDDNKCEKLTDPFHRYEYRHKDLPDFLIPCRDQKKCPNTSKEHRIRYSHGEDVFKKGSSSSKSKDDKSDAKSKDEDRRTVCKWGNDCKTIGDPAHRARYSHPKS